MRGPCAKWRMFRPPLKPMGGKRRLRTCPLKRSGGLVTSKLAVNLLVADTLAVVVVTPRFRLYPKRTLAVHCDSNDATGEPMQYFEASDGKLERIGKVIGDTLAALVILFVIILALRILF